MNEVISTAVVQFQITITARGLLDDLRVGSSFSTLGNIMTFGTAIEAEVFLIMVLFFSWFEANVSKLHGGRRRFGGIQICGRQARLAVSE